MAGRLLFALFCLRTCCITDAVQLGRGAQHPDAGKKSVPKQSPELAEALKQPQMLFDSMSSRMSELQSTLLTSKSESQVVLSEKRELYEKKLKQQEDQNKAVAKVNDGLTARIKSLTDKNTQLRHRAEEIQNQCHEVQADLVELRENITIAREYLEHVLNDSEAILHEETEVNILAELEQEEVNASESQVHDAVLEEIASAGKIAMIQLGAASPDAEDAMPEDMLRNLLASWDGISNEQNASEISLKESFENEFAAGEEQYAALRQNQTRLNSTLAEVEALNQNLTASVEYLEKTHGHLLEQRASLRQFARKLSNHPAPKLRLFQTPHSKSNVYPHANAATAVKPSQKKVLAESS